MSSVHPAHRPHRDGHPGMTQDVTDECRPAAGAADGSLHWLLVKHSGHYNIGVWHIAPREYWVMDGRIWYPPDVRNAGMTYHAPASPDDATERAMLADENARLRRLVQSAFNEGFTEGMREHMTSRGGKPWVDSTACKALAALTPGDAS